MAFVAVMGVILLALPVVFALVFHGVRLFGRWAEWVFVKLGVIEGRRTRGPG